MTVRAAGLIIYRIFSQKIEYLLLQTSYGQNHWTPPKGHVDPGESDFDTAVRETVEESGLKREDFKVEESFKNELKYEVKGKSKIVVYWLAKVKDPFVSVKLSNEHQDYKWLRLEEAKINSGFQDMNTLLEKCEEFILKSDL